ncbi:MAG: glutamyl-tRNA reductase [Acidimicrobiaceae bacterium]|nr:glutamyl-tRNA reductase [Acidimicrobiaceae bacterium]
MPLAAVSICESDVSTPEFDRFAMGAAATEQLYKVLAQEDVVSEAVVVSTCYRTEVYADVSEFHHGVERIVELLSTVTSARRTEISQVGKVFYGRGVAEHLYRVSSGIESRILGETEVLGQLKSALDEARQAKVIGKILNRLFQSALEVGKDARSKTAISRGATSLASASVKVLESRIESDPANATVALLGAGAVGSEIAEVASERFRRLWISSKSFQSAEVIAKGLGGSVSPASFDMVRSLMSTVDAVVFATSASEFLLDSEELEVLSAARGTSRLILLDLGVPRNVHPGASEYSNLELVTLEAVNALLDVEAKKRTGSVKDVEDLIEVALQEFEMIGASRNLDPVIEALYRSAENIRLEELAKFAPKFVNLGDKERAAVEALTHQIVAKILHQPTSQLRRQAASSELGRLLEDVRLMFDL